MSTFALILCGVAFAGLIAWSVYDFLDSAARFVAPDHADRREIIKAKGDTPEAEAALAHRFGPGRHWKDAATGLTGLAGIAILVWIWFG